MACLLHLHAIDATQTKSLFSTLRRHRNVSRGRGASGGSFASDSRWPENFSRSPLAMRWRRRASRRFWPASCRPHLRLSHTPSTRLAGRRRRAVVELRVASHPFGILAEPRFEGALAGLLLLPRLGLARAPRRVPALASYKFLEVDRGAADGLLLRFRRRPVCFTCLHAVDASLAVHAWHSRRPHAIEALRLSLSCLSAPLRHRRYGVLHAIDATGPPRNRRDAPRHRRDASLATGRGARTVVAAAARPNAPSLRRTSRPGPASCARRRP